jgi:elongation factor P
VLFYRGAPINIELPAFVEATVTRCEPGIKGDTASGATKPAVIETGATIQVPLFIKEGEVIRVDTRSGAYVERVG